MHATTEQLLSIRDGESVTDHARSHVDYCDVCQAEIARLARVQEELRALPAIEPGKRLWQAVAVESLDRPDRHRFSWASAAGIAASFVVALVLVSRMDREPAATVGTNGTAVTANNQSVSEPAASVAEVVPPVESISVDQLRTRSRRLENLRRAMPERPQVVRASTTRTIVDLEDRIALVDYRLSAAERLGLSPQQEKALWQERVYLMNTLVRLEYAQINSPRY